MSISITTLLMGRMAYDKLPVDQKQNIKELNSRLHDFEVATGVSLTVTSGLRLPADNAKTGGAPSSLHLICKAADCADPDGKLWKVCIANLPLLKSLGLWLEDVRWTHDSKNKSKRWVHFQTQPPRSGRRIFVPSTNPQIGSDIWDGKYDHKYD